MCGITGIYAFNEKGAAFLHLTSAATYALLKRGPDDEGLFYHNRVALGHRRLSIIDTSSNGQQPFTDNSGRYTLVFNGEIFNYRELRKSLESKGITFRSQSDTEVLLNLFILEREKCLDKLNGEFALAVYDKEEDSLFLARDRFGIKPLYYYRDKDRFVFGSEMKALMHYQIPRKLDYASLLMYLQLNYVPGDDSIFKNVKKLLPGTYMKLSHKGNEAKVYYSVSYTDTTPEKSISFDKASETVKEHLATSVRERLVSDVPLGTFLSGGIDSSIITALAARDVKNLNTFSVGFRDEPFFDETRYAKLLADKYKTNHTVFSLTNDDLLSNLFEVLDYLDEPFADSSALAVYILSKHTSKKVKVVLSGDGADELFGGYNKHKAEMKLRNGGVLPNVLRLISPFTSLLSQSRNTKTGNILRQINRFSEGASLSDRERYWRWASLMRERDAMETLQVPVSSENYLHRKKELLKYIPAKSSVNDVLQADLHIVLPGDMLVKVDRMSMANSLEVRVPFLDHRLVNYVSSLPWVYKIDHTVQKKILKHAFADMLPQELLNRKKQGFEVPLLKWFRNELNGLINNDLLNDNFIIEQGIFNPGSISSLKKKLFSTSPGDAASQVWALIVFQYWWKKNF